MAADQQRAPTEMTPVEAFMLMADPVVEASRSVASFIIKACVPTQGPEAPGVTGVAPCNISALLAATEAWKNVLLPMYRRVIRRFGEYLEVYRKEAFETLVVCVLIDVYTEMRRVHYQLNDWLATFGDDNHEHPEYIRGKELTALCEEFLKWLEAGGSDSTDQDR